MKKLLVLLCLIYCADSFAQKKDPGENIKVNDKRIYLFFENNKLEYFTTKNHEDGASYLNNNTTFSLTDNSINLYLKWINPVRYKINWTDTTLVDQRDQVLKDYVTSLAGQFGAPVTGLNGSSQVMLAMVKSKGASTHKGKAQGNAAKPSAQTTPKDTLAIPDFNSYELTSTYIQLRSSGLLNEADIKSLNALSPALLALDQNITAGIPKAASDLFLEIFNTTDYNKVDGIVTEANSDLSNWQTGFTAITTGSAAVTTTLAGLQLSSKPLENLYKTTVLNFLAKLATDMSNNQKIVAKITPVITIFKNSINDPSTEDKLKGYFKIRNFSFVDGKMVQTKMVFTEYQMNSDNTDFVKKSDVITSTLNFMKYDRVKIFVSTGVFYGSSTLQGFGVSPSGSQFTVTEQDIKSNTPVTALFCNFGFGDSRYFSPLIQLGIDPTKKRPFLLGGIGFVIPSSSFAISGGPLWTWQQTLQKLSIGQLINSTTDLDKDVTYNFQVAPKGWYLGIQYNF